MKSYSWLVSSILVAIGGLTVLLSSLATISGGLKNFQALDLNVEFVPVVLGVGGGIALSVTAFIKVRKKDNTGKKTVGE